MLTRSVVIPSLSCLGYFDRVRIVGLRFRDTSEMSRFLWPETKNGTRGHKESNGSRQFIME